MKKVKVICLLVVLFIFATPINVFCEETNNSNFLFDASRQTIYGYKGTYPKKLIIPKYINGVEVDGIREGAFDGADIDVIEIPENLTNLELTSEGYSVFPSKSYLYDYNIVERDVEVRFYEGEKVGGFFIDRNRGAIIGYDDDADKNVVIPEKLDGMVVKEIGSYAFWEKDITSLTLPSSLELIELGAFCSNKLTDVELPKSVNYVASESFWGNEIIRLTIHNPNAKLGWRAFYENKLNVAELPRGTMLTNGVKATSDNLKINQVFDRSVQIYFYTGEKYGSIYFDKAKQTITKYSAHGGPNVVIPQTIDGVAVKTIGPDAFFGEYVNSVKIPEGVTTLEDYSISYCGLTKVELPQSLEVIGNSAFAGNQLESLELPSNLKSIGYEAFRGNKLTSVKIPKNIKLIDEYAFADNVLTNVELNKGLEVIGYSAFSRNQLEEVDIPNTVVEIEPYAFFGNCFKYIFIPESVTTIGNSAFDFTGSSNPTVELMETLKYVYVDSEDKKYPVNYQTLSDYYVFDRYSNKLIYNGLRYDDFFFDKDTNTITGYSEIASKDVVIPSQIDGVDVNVIGNGAFDYKEIESVVLPNGVTKIEENAFMSNSISKVEIPDSVEFIGGQAFAFNEIKELKLSNSIKTIEMWAFRYNKLKEVDIPNSLESIGDSAFEVNELKWVELPITLKEITSFNYESESYIKVEPTVENVKKYNVFDESCTVAFYTDYKFGDFYVDKENGAITGYSDRGDRAVEIPSEVDGVIITKIADGAFKEKEITSVIMPETIVEIGKEAFMQNKLTDVVIPNSVTTIGKSAFSNNLLKTVMLSENLTEISDNAFYENNIASIVIPKNVIYIGRSAFENNKIIELAIPSSVKEIGIRAFYSNNIRKVNVSSNLENIIGYKNSGEEKEYYEANKENLIELNVFDSNVEIVSKINIVYIIIGGVALVLVVVVLVVVTGKKRKKTNEVVQVEEKSKPKRIENKEQSEKDSKIVEEKNEYNSEIIEEDEK